MPAGGSRRGRRDNGLSAAEYAAVGDVDPRVGEHLLDVLGNDGIAAYLLPATDLHPVTRTTTLPAVPTDRLFADREHLSTAKEYLARLRADESAATAADAAADPPVTGPVIDPVTPGRQPDGIDLDAAWADIIAAYETEFEAAVAPWPASENLPERGADDTDPDLGRRLEIDTAAVDDTSAKADPAPTPPARPADEPSLLDALDTFGAGLPDADEDEGYTPPPPPPVPKPPLPAVLALLGIVGGLILFFKPDLLPIDEDVSRLVGFGLLLAGVTTLIWRLRPGDEDDDEPGDDGAVV